MFYDKSFLWFGKVFLKLPQEVPNWLDIISPPTQKKIFRLEKDELYIKLKLSLFFKIERL